MRILIVPAVACTALFATPAAAQSVRHDDIARSLPHPYEVEDAGNRLGAAIGAIVNVPVGDVVRAIDPAAPVRRDATIADVAGRDDPDFEGRLQDQVAGMSIKAADLVRGISAAAPALQRSLDDLTRNLDAALGGYRR